jgi:hypothetical protein
MTMTATTAVSTESAVWTTYEPSCYVLLRGAAKTDVLEGVHRPAATAVLILLLLYYCYW